MKQFVGYIFSLLVVLMGCTTDAERTRMRSELDSINQRNRNDQPFTVQDVEPYVSFFDDHGTANDRLLAHYLLGRAYYEQGEAPMALQCYHDAVECADTLSSDCDYAQLARVYGQMAEIFYYQGLYRQQLDHSKLAEKYSWVGKDTLAALMNYERLCFAYDRLNMTDSAIYVIEHVAQQYNRYGYPRNAAISLGSIIRTLIDKGALEEAKRYMDRYEKESGLFDSQHNIESGREIYYKAKGLYYLYNNRPDSAEYYFRKELMEGKDINNQNAASLGLALLYKQQHHPDSAIKYALYAYTINDSIYAQMSTETIERMQAMFDYTRHQEEASEEKEKSTQRIYAIWMCIGFIVILCLIGYIMIKELARKKHEVEQKYMQSQSIIEQARHDLDKLRINEEINRGLISEKEQAIREQETIIKSLLCHNASGQSLADIEIAKTDIYKRFIHLSVVGQQPTSIEWEQLQENTFTCYPGFGDFMQKHVYLLNDKEYKVCLLVRIGLKPTYIANMIGVASSYITELRIKLLQKLFGVSGDSKTFDKRIKEIY